MKEAFYNSYVNELKEALASGNERSNRREWAFFSQPGQFGIESKSKRAMRINKEKDLQLFESLNPLAVISGKKTNYHLKPGAHPDFPLLDNESFENHYIVSVFVDVKGSKNLFKKYDPFTVANIINTIQRAAVHTIWHFDGYIQRYHGDGLFAYFGGKKASLATAVKQALTACSFFSYFMRNDIRNLFSELGIENINTRIGIDAGEAEDTLWYMAGSDACSEITTCSLYTSLAAQMQSSAKNNGIVIGDHVKIQANLPEEMFDTVRNAEGRKEYAFEIPEESYRYSQWHFEWNRFLKVLPNVEMDEGERFFIKEPETQSKAKMEQLLASAALIQKGEAYLNKNAQIQSAPIGMKHQPHQFHCE